MSLDLILRPLEALDLGDHQRMDCLRGALKVMCWYFWLAEEELSALL